RDGGREPGAEPQGLWAARRPVPCSKLAPGSILVRPGHRAASLSVDLLRLRPPPAEGFGALANGADMAHSIISSRRFSTASRYRSGEGRAGIPSPGAYPSKATSPKPRAEDAPDDPSLRNCSSRSLRQES